MYFLYFNLILKIFFNNAIDFLDPINQDEIEQDAPKKYSCSKTSFKN
jgi:hypothetical protein